MEESVKTQDSQSESRPEWLPPKYKTPEDLAKGYKELEKKIGSFVGAPEEYEIPESIQSKRLANVLSRKGKELNMSQEAMTQILTEYDSDKKLSKEQFKTALDSLDPEKKKNVTETVMFLKNTLGDSEAEKVLNAMTSIDDVLRFDKIRKAKNPLAAAEKPLVNEMVPESKEKFMASIDRDRLYGLNGKTVDIKYREEIQRKMNDIFNIR